MSSFYLTSSVGSIGFWVLVQQKPRSPMRSRVNPLRPARILLHPQTHRRFLSSRLKRSLIVDRCPQGYIFGAVGMDVLYCVLGGGCIMGRAYSSWPLRLHFTDLLHSRFVINMPKSSSISHVFFHPGSNPHHTMRPLVFYSCFPMNG